MLKSSGKNATHIAKYSNKSDQVYAFSVVLLLQANCVIQCGAAPTGKLCHSAWCCSYRQAVPFSVVLLLQANCVIQCGAAPTGKLCHSVWCCSYRQAVPFSVVLLLQANCVIHLGRWRLQYLPSILPTAIYC